MSVQRRDLLKTIGVIFSIAIATGSALLVFGADREQLRATVEKTRQHDDQISSINEKLAEIRGDLKVAIAGIKRLERGKE